MTHYKANSWWERNVRDPKILDLRDQGMSIWQISLETHYGESTIQAILKHYEELGK